MRFSKGVIIKMVIHAFMFTLVLSFIAPISQAILAGVIAAIMYDLYDRDSCRVRVNLGAGVGEARGAPGAPSDG